MPPYIQALLIWFLAYVFTAGLDGGNSDMGLLTACWLFWIVVSILFWRHYWQPTRADLLFLRWGSIPFAIAGIAIIAPIVDYLFNHNLR